MKRLILFFSLLFATVSFAATGDVTFIGPGLQSVPLPTYTNGGGVRARLPITNKYITGLGTDGRLTDAFFSASSIVEGYLPNIVQYGVTNVEDIGTVEEAIAVIGAVIPQTLRISTDQTLTGNLVVTSNIQLVFVDGAKITHGAYTVTYPGSSEGWDDTQKFSGTGAVIMNRMRPEWLGGGYNDGVTDEYSLIQNAFTNCKETLFRKKTYMIGTELIASSAMQIKRIAGEGPQSIIKKKVDTVPYVIAVVSATGVTIEDLAGDGNRSVTDDYTNSIFVFYLATTTNCVIRNVHAYGALADNIVIEYGKGNKVIGSWSYNSNKDGIYASGSEAVVIANNHSYGNGSNSTGGGIAVSATWGATVTSNICYDNIQFDILLSRGTRFATVSGNSNGPFTLSQAPIGFYVLGEGLGGTLHGFDYGDGSTYYGASDSQITGNNFHGEMRLELLDSSAVANNTVHGVNQYGINCLGCISNTISNNVLKNYTDWGILLNFTAKNDTVQSDRNIVGLNYYDTLATGVHNNGTGVANIYNDIESGGWTPVIVGADTAGTYQLLSSAARYMKAGNQITLTANVTLAASVTGGGSGNLRISGVPYPRNTNITPVGAVMFRGIDFTGSAPVVRFVGASELYFPVNNDNGSEVAVDIGGVAATDTIDFTIVYEMAEP